MLDLNTLRNSNRFRIEGSPRLALLHHGFRTRAGAQDPRRPVRFASRYPSLGLLNLARSLQVDAEAGRLRCRPELRYFDEDCYRDDEELAAAIADWLGGAQWRFLLVGMYTVAVERTTEMLARIDPEEVCIVVGGPHVTVAPSISYAHLAVRGEGGAAMRHIVNCLLEPGFGEGPDSRGVCFQSDGLVHMSVPAFDNSLATIPAPAYDYSLSQSRTDPEQRPRGVWWKTAGRSPQIYVCTQSCRARCTFCSTYLIHGRLVSRPLSLVREDMHFIVDVMGHDSIEFHDDDLLQHEAFAELMELLASKRVTWTCNARAEFIDGALARQMYACGCRKVFLGIESLEQETLDYYRKGTTVAMNEAAARELDAAGIGVAAGFIIGAPHQTVTGILADLDRVLALPIFYLSPSILTPDIGTVEYQRAKKLLPELRLLGDDGSNINIKPRPDLFGSAEPYGLPTMCASVPKEALNELYELACCSFFLRHSAYERALRYTRPERAQEVPALYASMRERAALLAATARVSEVRERAQELARVPLPLAASGVEERAGRAV